MYFTIGFYSSIIYLAIIVKHIKLTPLHSTNTWWRFVHETGHHPLTNNEVSLHQIFQQTIDTRRGLSAAIVMPGSTVELTLWGTHIKLANTHSRTWQVPYLSLVDSSVYFKWLNWIRSVESRDNASSSAYINMLIESGAIEWESRW